MAYDGHGPCMKILNAPTPKVKPLTRFSIFHDCPPGGCIDYFLPAPVVLTVFGMSLITNRFSAEKVLAGLPDHAQVEIKEELGDIDTTWYPPITFPWEDW